MTLSWVWLWSVSRKCGHIPRHPSVLYHKPGLKHMSQDTDSVSGCVKRQFLLTVATFAHHRSRCEPVPSAALEKRRTQFPHISRAGNSENDQGGELLLRILFLSRILTWWTSIWLWSCLCCRKRATCQAIPRRTKLWKRKSPRTRYLMEAHLRYLLFTWRSRISVVSCKKKSTAECYCISENKSLCLFADWSGTFQGSGVAIQTGLDRRRVRRHTRSADLFNPEIWHGLASRSVLKHRTVWWFHAVQRWVLAFHLSCVHACQQRLSMKIDLLSTLKCLLCLVQGLVTDCLAKWKRWQPKISKSG